MNGAIAAGLVFAFAACGCAFAADHSDDCATVLASTPIRDFVLMRVAGTKRVHFADCFAATCVVEAYVVPGDLLVAAPAPGDLVCTVFPNKRGGTKGWIPSGFLTPAATESDPALTAWTGNWQMHEDANIEIRIAGGKLAVAGQAFWTGGPVNSIHTGELEGVAAPAGGIVALRKAGGGEYDCAADLRLVGPYLAVKDNGRCGGLNVSFIGVYRRQ
jgi:hypothetical protein